MTILYAFYIKDTKVVMDGTMTTTILGPKHSFIFQDKTVGAIVSPISTTYKSFRSRDDFCRLLVTFVNSSSPDQNVCPDLNPNTLTL